MKRGPTPAQKAWRNGQRNIAIAVRRKKDSKKTDDKHFCPDWASNPSLLPKRPPGK